MAIFHQRDKNPLIHENGATWLYYGKREPGLIGDFKSVGIAPVVPR